MKMITVRRRETGSPTYVTGEARRLRLPRINIPATFVLLIVGFLVLYPIGMLFYGSLRGASPGTAGALTLNGFIEAYSDASVYRVFLTTVLFALGATLSCIAVAVLLAWIVARTDTPHTETLELLITLPFFIPPVLKAMAWALLANPRTGLLNQLVQAAFPFMQGPIFNVYSFLGLVWVSTVGFTSFLFLMIVSAFKSMDAAMEEASRMSGARALSTFLRITLPMMAPAVLGAAFFSFVIMMETLEVPLILGSPAKIFVLSNKIFDYMHYFPAKYGPAAALAVTCLVITVVLVLLQWRLLGQRSYATISGRGFQARRMMLGRWRYVTFAMVVAYFIAAAVLPISQLILGSFTKLFGVYTSQMWTLNNYGNILADANFWGALKNTLFMAGAAATAGMLLASLAAYIVVRTGYRARTVLDIITWLPMTVPAIALGLGFLWAYAILPRPFVLYGSIWLLMLIFITRSMPVGTRTMSGTLIQVGQELEECSRVHGASWHYTFLHILLVLVRPGFMAGWIVVFVAAVRDVASIIFVYGPNSRTLSVLVLEYWEGAKSETVAALSIVMMIVMFTMFALERYFAHRSRARATTYHLQ